MRGSTWAWLVFAALLALGPLYAYPFLVMKVMCFALFAASFNLLMGYAGLLSFGHAAFFGTGSYATAMLLKYSGWSPLWGLLGGVGVACALGVVVGTLSIRRQGIYFSMITLALAQMVYFVFLQAPAAGGEDGLQDVPRGKLFGLVDLGNDINLYYVILVIFLAALAFIFRVIHSPFGHALQAIRENEVRAVSLGYNAVRIKLLVFVMSAGLAGLAGGLKVLVMRFATLSDLDWHTSGEVILMTLIGGLGTLPGPLVGAAFIVVLQNSLADKVGSWVTVIMGGLFVLCVLTVREGIVGGIVSLGRRLGLRSADER